MLKFKAGLILLALAPGAEAAVLNVAQADLIALSLEQLADLEVTSVSKQPQKYLQSPAAISVITQEDIRRSGATSLVEALRLAPGLHVARINSNQWSVGVRGFGSRLSRAVLVLFDGRAVYSPLFAGTYWEIQDYVLEDIDRIEVIRGPGGSLWGANAFNGVINIITKSAKDTQGGLVSAGGGTEERGFGSVRYGGKTGGGLDYRVYGKYFNRDAAFHPDGDDYDAWEMGQGGFRTDWNADSRDSFTVQGDAYKGAAGQKTSVGSYTPPFLEVRTERNSVSGANLLGRWNRAISAGAGAAVQVYYDRTNRTESNFREFRDTFDLDVQNHFTWALDQTLTWGGGYRLTANRTDAPSTVSFDPANRTDQLGNLFVQDELPLLPERLKLTVGTKVEHNEYSGWEVQPSGRLGWTPTDTQLLWTAVSRAVRTPSPVDQDLQLTAPLAAGAPAFIRLSGNRNFKSEKLIAYEAGYRVQPNEAVFMSAAAFYNDYDDMLSLETGAPFVETTPPPAHSVIPLLEANNLEGQTHGLELMGKWLVFPWWQLEAEYAFLMMHLRAKTGSTDLTTPAQTAGSSPRHQARFQSSMDFPYGLELDPMLRYVDTLSSQGVPAYWNLDIRLGWHPHPRWELALVGQNLLASHHPESDPSPSLPPIEVQRGVYAKATWKW